MLHDPLDDNTDRYVTPEQLWFFVFSGVAAVFLAGAVWLIWRGATLY